jgi:hypothetical protein
MEAGRRTVSKLLGQEPDLPDDEDDDELEDDLQPQLARGTAVSSDFKDWFQATQGMRKAPKGAELYEYLDKRFGKCKGSVWIGVRFNQVYENEAFVLPDNGGL